MPARSVVIPSTGAQLAGELSIPTGAASLVVFVHGSGSSRMSPRNQWVAQALNEDGFATLLFDLLSAEEGEDRGLVFDIAFLSQRLLGVLAWLRTHERTHDMAMGLFGASTGAAAALTVAANPDAQVSAVMSRGGRPDLTPVALLERVQAPTLLIVGGADDVVLALNREAARHLRCEHRLLVVPGATHLFEEPGTLAAVASAASSWCAEHL